MKILFLTQNLAPFRMAWIEELSKYYEITVYHIGEYEKSVNDKYRNYIPRNVYCKDISVSFFKRVKVYDYKRILKEEPDITIIDGYGFLAQAMLILLFKLIKKNYLLSIDGGLVEPRENFIKKIFKGILLGGAEGYLSTSEVTDNYLVHYGAPLERIYRHYFSYVFKNEILKSPSTVNKSKYRNELGLHNKFTIISVGKFEFRKGFDILLEAVNLIEEDIQVIIIGGKKSDLANLSINSIDKDRVMIIDFCEKDKLNMYYRASDIFVLPTRYDAWGLVIGEAMSHGLPIITTDKCVAGLSMIEDEVNGYIIPVNNSHKLRESILKLYLNPGLSNLISENNAKLIYKYTIEESAKNDIENLKEVIGGRI